MLLFVTICFVGCSDKSPTYINNSNTWNYDTTGVFEFMADVSTQTNPHWQINILSEKEIMFVQVWVRRSDQAAWMQPVWHYRDYEIIIKKELKVNIGWEYKINIIYRK